MSAFSSSECPVQFAELEPGTLQLRVPAGAARAFKVPELSPELAKKYLLACQRSTKTVNVTVVLDGSRAIAFGPPKSWEAGVAQRVDRGELKLGDLRILRAGASRDEAPASSTIAAAATATGGAARAATSSGSLAKILSRAFKVGITEDRGGCGHMEDANIVHAPAGAGFAFVGILDGHGGTGAAHFCREHLHFNVMASAHFGRGNMPAALLDGFRKTEAALIMEQAAALRRRSSGGEEGGSGGGGVGVSAPAAAPVCCGSTALLLLLHGASGSMHIAWLGDCRAVLCRRGQAIELTSDHSLSDPKERARAISDGGVVESNRLGGYLEVSRALD